MACGDDAHEDDGALSVEPSALVCKTGGGGGGEMELSLSPWWEWSTDLWAEFLVTFTYVCCRLSVGSILSGLSVVIIGFFAFASLSPPCRRIFS